VGFSAVEYSDPWESSVISEFPGSSGELSVMTAFTGVPCSRWQSGSFYGSSRSKLLARRAWRPRGSKVHRHHGLQPKHKTLMARVE